MRSYRRRLPHIDTPGVPTFVTWRLWGSLPPERVFEREHLSSGEAFVAWDRLLDTARSGPFYLRQEEIAGLVQEQLRKADAGGLCSLHAFVIMPNHVHLLCTPFASLAELMRRVKGPTAHLANGILGRRGEKFWHEEYFDRIVRIGDEFGRIRRYIEWNPVKAGLVARPEEFRWSSVWRG
jgi:REP element-mobilizing transposase RayT